ncbi:MAG: COQ9 family protein [Pseudomonadota bacterium]|nr:COQ9 family protein [Pseudomonadota bacterium]
MTESDDIRRLLLDAALAHIPFDGWTKKSLDAAGRDLGLPAAVVVGCFPEGVSGLANFFSAEFDRRMLAELTGRDLAAMSVRARIVAVVRIRLELLAHHKEAMRRLATYSTMRGRSLAAVRAAAGTVDVIWRTAGDKSTDFNYYTKRGLLAPVYGATLLYWLSDASEGSEETWAFLERRLNEVHKLQSMQRRLQGMARRLPNPPRLLQRVRGHLRSA